MVTFVVSLAVPLKVGVVMFDCATGWANVTAGGSVFTVNVTGELSPALFPSELVSVANAVYVCSPEERGALILLAVKTPPLGVAVASVTWLPSKRMCTTTWVVSLAVPVKDGFRLFDGDV